MNIKNFLITTGLLLVLLAPLAGVLLYLEHLGDAAPWWAHLCMALLWGYPCYWLGGYTAHKYPLSGYDQ